MKVDLANLTVGELEYLRSYYAGEIQKATARKSMLVVYQVNLDRIEKALVSRQEGTE